VIDAHLHAVNPRLPGVKHFPVELDAPPEVVAAALAAQMEEAGVRVALGMGHMPAGEDDPLGVRSTLDIARYLPGLFAIGVADPTRTDTAHLQAVERALRAGSVVALKGYLGYLYHGADSPGYVPYFELAAQFEVPFVFHTGDNYSTVAKVKYAHPLAIDEVAVDHRDVQIVMAHFGNPWVMDAAEVVYKNDNVWVDLSGLLVGDGDYFAAQTERGVLARVVERIKQGVEFTERPDRFLFGTDWPLAPMSVYYDFVRQMFAEKDHPAVFHDNAERLFRLKACGRAAGGPAR
jgi:predicted TIM-barrel fold metal-dependent hydrolase